MGMAGAVVRRVRTYGPSLLKGRGNVGWCPICEARTLFVNTGGHPRNCYFCARCGSIPRQRAVIFVLADRYPSWRTLEIHESSPGGPSSAKLRRDAPGYSDSFWLPAVGRGAYSEGRRSEDLQRLTFADESFDLFVTQDVFEHVFDAAAAFKEIARVLRPGGAHLFTMPYWPEEPTRLRARFTDGQVEHLEEPMYHDDPVDADGALVIRDWGFDAAAFIMDACGLPTEIVTPLDKRFGLLGDFQEVFVTRKESRLSPGPLHSAAPRA
jgi:SAM-dependent methyltransferase